MYLSFVSVSALLKSPCQDLAASFTGELQAGATDSHWPVRSLRRFRRVRGVRGKICLGRFC